MQGQTRILREYKRLAHQYHDCHVCGKDILPGSEYSATVQLTRGKYFQVFKCHEYPYCEFDDPWDDEKRNWDSNESTEEESSEEPLPKAA